MAGQRPRYVRQYMEVRLYDLTALLAAVQRARITPDVGHLDADRTYEELVRNLNRTVAIDKRVVVSALAAANFLDEKSLFFHPSGKSFDDTVRDVLNGLGVYDKTYNLVTWSDGEEPKK